MPENKPSTPTAAPGSPRPEAWVGRIPEQTTSAGFSPKRGRRDIGWRSTLTVCPSTPAGVRLPRSASRADPPAGHRPRTGGPAVSSRRRLGPAAVAGSAAAGTAPILALKSVPLAGCPRVTALAVRETGIQRRWGRHGMAHQPTPRGCSPCPASRGGQLASLCLRSASTPHDIRCGDMRKMS